MPIQSQRTLSFSATQEVSKTLIKNQMTLYTSLPTSGRVDIVVISPSFDFMESFSQLCLEKLEKKLQKRQEIWLYYG